MVWLKLTNGVEYLNNLGLGDLGNVRFIRIPSTWCEQKKFEKVLWSLGADFYIHLAGEGKVLVVDFSKHDESRAMWQGVKFIEYVLNYYWFSRVICSGKFYEAFNEFRKRLSKSCIKYIKYFKKFLYVDSIEIETITYRTERDGDYRYFSDILRKYFKK